MESLPFEEYDLKPVTLELLQQVLEKNLKEFFEDVKVSVSDCPNLSSEPYNLATDGIGGGSTTIVDLGGVPYLIPLADRSKVYDLATVIPKYVGSDRYPDGWHISGAAAGPWPAHGSNCEMVVNLKIGKDGQMINNKSKVALTSNGTETDLKVKDLDTETRCALLANLMVSGGTGKVLEIKCKNRLDAKTNFTTSIRDAINKDLGSVAVGLGGIFTVNYSKTKIHVMRDFSTTPLLSNEDVDNWLKFFQANPPFLCQSVLVSTDPGLDLRVEHSHGWTINDGPLEAGHYHYDLLPKEVEYHGIYAVAQKIVRIDRPTATHQIGRD